MSQYHYVLNLLHEKKNQLDIDFELLSVKRKEFHAVIGAFKKLDPLSADTTKFIASILNFIDTRSDD